MFEAKHKDSPCLVGFKGPIKVGIQALVAQYTLVSGIWIAHLARTLNNTKWFFRNATEGFQFSSPEFSGMMNWKSFKQSPWNVTLNQETKTPHGTGFPEVSSCYKQADPTCSQAEAQPSLSGGQQTGTQHQPSLYKKSHLGKIILGICEKEKGKKQ